VVTASATCADAASVGFDSSRQSTSNHPRQVLPAKIRS
jgi:hypothetical protein